MKIIGKSNFDDDMVNDILIAENVPDEYASFLTDKMNEQYSTGRSKYFYEAKPDYYELYVWEP